MGTIRKAHRQRRTQPVSSNLTIKLELPPRETASGAQSVTEPPNSAMHPPSESNASLAVEYALAASPPGVVDTCERRLSGHNCEPLISLPVDGLRVSMNGTPSKIAYTWPQPVADVYAPLVSNSLVGPGGVILSGSVASSAPIVIPAPPMPQFPVPASPHGSHDTRRTGMSASTCRPIRRCAVESFQYKQFELSEETLETRMSGILKHELGYVNTLPGSSPR